MFLKIICNNNIITYSYILNQWRRSSHVKWDYVLTITQHTLLSPYTRQLRLVAAAPQPQHVTALYPYPGDKPQQRRREIRKSVAKQKISRVKNSIIYICTKSFHFLKSFAHSVCFIHLRIVTTVIPLRSPCHIDTSHPSIHNNSRKLPSHQPTRLSRLERLLYTCIVLSKKRKCHSAWPSEMWASVFQNTLAWEQQEWNKTKKQKNSVRSEAWVWKQVKWARKKKFRRPITT